MPTSVRLDPEVAARLRKMAKTEGVPLSELLRRAAARYCNELANTSLDLRLADVVGVVGSTGGRARRSGEAYRKALQRRS
jgi:predicted DNA-binding protein